jgi:hypothetical protein
MVNQFSENTAVGHLALAANTLGGSNKAVGFQALMSEIDGFFNAAFGDDAMESHKAFIEKQHKVENLRSIAAQQQKQIEALTAGLQKVSAQLAAASPSDGGLEVSRSAPKTVLNNH